MEGKIKLTEKYAVDGTDQVQRKRFTQISDHDIALLRELRPLMEKHADQIVEAFYAHLLTFAGVRAFFPNSEILTRVKYAQRDYLLDLFRGSYEEDYFEKRLQIGVAHERIGLVPKWYLGGNAVFMKLIAPLIAREYRFKPKRMVASLMALNKIMNLDQQLVIDTYIGSMVEKVSAIETLKNLLKQIQEGINVLNASSSQIVAATTQVASGAVETASAVSETTTTVEEVKQTAQVASQKSKYVSETAQRSVQVSQTGKRSVEEMIQGMSRLREQMEDIAESIMRLSEQSQAIGEIIAAVNDLAEQSNLLAVNASIEAAKAGEHGKGFAVVAQEVRSLAEQSKQATAQVRGILMEIQKATSKAVIAAEQGSKTVETGVRQATEAGETIRMLAESISEAAQAATQIAASSQQQLVGMDQVASAMGNIKQASTQNVAGTKQAETAAQGLNELGEKLKQLMEHYKA